ncbi:Amidase domain-containing protein [Fusarium keratoplasticum]|nr:Amidase domain-containing protein [Fusarium keratoplasticum]
MLPFTICVVAGLQYLIHPQKLGSIQETINSDAIIPITLLTTDEVFGDLEGILQLFESYDDVFNLEFGSILVEKPGGSDNGVVNTTITGRPVYHLDQITALEDMAELPSGPYFLHGPNLHQAWRLYDDEFGAFAFGVIPDDLYQPDEFQPLTSSSLQGDLQAVPVPSRLYHPRPSPQKPLSGIRISISDTISLKGTHTTFSSRAWKSLYKNPLDATAEYARKLLDLGAVLVGKTKTSQFGTGVEWVDEQAPWSARGDGYERLKGSSVGAAAASIGYEWLQHSIGVDNGMIVPDGGIYSIATSHISTDNMWKTSHLDRTRLLSRSLEDLLDITTKTLDQQPQEPKSPKRVLYPVDLISVDETQQEALDGFVTTLEELLGVEAQSIDIGAAWAENPPDEASDEDMQAYMKHAPFWLWCYEYYHAFDEFRHEYRQKTQKEAFAESTPQFFWDKCKTTTETEHRENLRRLEIYRQWFHENIMTPNADAILVLPCGKSSRVEHRDEAVAPPTISEGVGPEILASILGVPHLAVPFTQVPYESRISGRTEYQTVCVSVIGPQGSDTDIIQVVKQALEKAHVRTRVETGRFAFPADTLRNGRYPKTVPQPPSLSDEL